ncbi:MAG: hypothetical protein ABIH23_16915 [bacterium]
MREKCVIRSPLAGKNYKQELQQTVTDTTTRLKAYCAREGRMKIWVLCKAVNEWLDKHEAEL